MTGRFRAVIPTLPTCVLSIMLYCVNNGVTDSGGGLDIGNPTKLSVVDSLNRPVINASVKLLPANRWFASIFSGSSPVSDSAATDGSGIAAFDSIARGIYNIQIDHPAGGAFIRNFRTDDSASVRNFIIRHYGTILGVVTSASGTPARIRLEGTAHSADIAPDGSYSLADIAPGLCIPVVTSADSRHTVTNTVVAIASQTVVGNGDASFTTVIIDDFEDSAATLKLGRFIGQSRAYAMHADFENVAADYRIVPEGTNNGKVMKGVLITKGYWALLGFLLGIKADGDSTWDLHAATGLSFYAKGNGMLNVSFESDTIDKMGLFKHYSADVILDTMWRLHRISFDSLTFYNDDNPAPGIAWDVAGRSIKRIEFNALKQDTVRVWLDDVKIEGVDFSGMY